MIEVPSADEVRLLETEDKEIWANVGDLITVAEFTKETADHEFEDELANSPNYETKQLLRSIKESQDRIVDSIIEALEDMKNCIPDE